MHEFCVDLDPGASNSQAQQQNSKKADLLGKCES